MGNFYDEIKANPDMTRFMVETAYFAFMSNRAVNLTEPYPSFLLKKREMRPEKGNLEYIKQAQISGIEMEHA